MVVSSLISFLHYSRFRSEREAWIRAKYVEKRFVSKIRPRRTSAATRKLRRKNPIKRFSDGKIRKWSFQKDDTDAAIIAQRLSRDLSQEKNDSEDENLSPSSRNRVSTYPDKAKSSNSPQRSPSPHEVISSPGKLHDDRTTQSSIARVRSEREADSGTSSDECETEEEMRSLPPNQVCLLFKGSLLHI